MGLIRCEITGELVQEQDPQFQVVCKVGCISHSDFQSERDKVLDELEKGIKPAIQTDISGNEYVMIEDLADVMCFLHSIQKETGDRG